MRWIYLIVGAYFFLVMLFLSFGFGKIIFLMLGDSSWDYFKDLIEIASWVATIFGAYGVFLATRAYRDSENDKKILRVERLLEELKMDLLFDLNQLRARRWEIKFNFSKLNQAIKKLPVEGRLSYEEFLAVFCKSKLEQIKLNHLFKINSDVPELDDWNESSSYEDFTGKILPAVAKCFYDSNLISNSMLVTEDSGIGIMDLLIMYAYRDAYQEYTYVDDNGERWWKNRNGYPDWPDEKTLSGDQDIYSINQFGLVPAVVLYLKWFGREKNRILSHVN